MGVTLRTWRVAAAAVVLAGQAHAQSFDQLLQEGRSLMTAGKPDDAARTFERAIAMNDRSAEAHLLLGNALGAIAQNANVLRQGYLARRVKGEFERAVALDATLVGAHEGLMQFYSRAPGVMGGSMDKARAEAATIAKLNPMRGRFAEANLALVEKDSLRAEKAYAAAVADAPDSVVAVNTYANFLVQHRRADEALPVIDRYLARHPADRAAQFAIGRLAALTGTQLDRGEQLLRGLLATPPDSGPRIPPENIHFRLGDIAVKRGDKAKARAEYEEALRINPKLEPARKALAAL